MKPVNLDTTTFDAAQASLRSLLNSIPPELQHLIATSPKRSGPPLTKPELEAALAANNAELAELEPKIAAALKQVEEEIKDWTPEQSARFFHDLAAQNVKTTGRDYINNPEHIRHLAEEIKLGRAIPHKLPTPEERNTIMENFFQEWCVKCPILQHLTQPESDLEDTAGALCPDETLDTCPILLQLRDVRNIKNPSATQNPDTNIKGDDFDASTTN